MERCVCASRHLSQIQGGIGAIHSAAIMPLFCTRNQSAPFRSRSSSHTGPSRSSWNGIGAILNVERLNYAFIVCTRNRLDGRLLRYGLLERAISVEKLVSHGTVEELMERSVLGCRV